jgi:hypothetical protein
MRTKRIAVFLVLLALAIAASPAHAGGVVTVCDEAHLLTALSGGGTITFACSGTITLTSEIVISANTTLDGNGQAVTISSNHTVRVFQMTPGNTFVVDGLTIADGSIADYEGGGIYNDAGVLIVSKRTYHQLIRQSRGHHRQPDDNSQAGLQGALR